MASITDNQRAANHSVTQRAIGTLIPALDSMSEPERFAFIARLAAASRTPVELVFWGETGDERIIASILDGVLLRGHTNYSWQTNSGCEASVQFLPGEDHHERT